MTFVEAIIKALKGLGGKACLTSIYQHVEQIKTDHRSKNLKATIRTTLQRHPQYFRRSPDMKDGWWELVSFQEELAKRDRKIIEQAAIIEEQAAELEAYRSIQTPEQLMVEMGEKVVALHQFNMDKLTDARVLFKAIGYEKVADIIEIAIKLRQQPKPKETEDTPVKVDVQPGGIAQITTAQIENNMLPK